MKLLCNQPLANYSTFGIGGPARYLIKASTKEHLQLAIAEANLLSLPFLVIGKGSNCLFDDKGFDGLVIVNRINFIEEEKEGVFRAGSGTSFPRLSVFTTRKGFAGLEFASGIPCTVGGAIFMNAGASGQETCRTLIEVDFMDDKGKQQIFLKKDLSFSYRGSPFQSMRGAICSALFQLSPLPEARTRQIEIVRYRAATQPYGEKSAGCIFCNPEGSSAGQLIEQCGLKGMRIGGAKVSDLHANFIVGDGQAKASDVQLLIKAIQQRVHAECGIWLKREVRYIPYRPFK